MRNAYKGNSWEVPNLLRKGGVIDNNSHTYYHEVKIQCETLQIEQIICENIYFYPNQKGARRKEREVDGELQSSPGVVVVGGGMGVGEGNYPSPTLSRPLWQPIIKVWCAPLKKQQQPLITADCRHLDELLSSAAAFESAEDEAAAIQRKRWEKMKIN